MKVWKWICQKGRTVKETEVDRGSRLSENFDSSPRYRVYLRRINWSELLLVVTVTNKNSEIVEKGLTNLLCLINIFYFFIFYYISNHFWWSLRSTIDIKPLVRKWIEKSTYWWSYTSTYIKIYETEPYLY